MASEVGYLAESASANPAAKEQPGSICCPGRTAVQSASCICAAGGNISSAASSTATATADTAGRQRIERLRKGRWAAHAATIKRVSRGGLLDIAVGADDRRVARHQQFNASGAGTNARLAVLQNDRIFQSLDEEIERRAADADRSQRRGDGVRFLEGVSPPASLLEIILIFASNCPTAKSGTISVRGLSRNVDSILL
jgi:hypothetical protein